jgi:hypothetical protein
MNTKYSEISCNVLLDSKSNKIGLYKVLLGFVPVG